MIVCLCTGVSDSQIRQAVRDGAGSVEEIGHKLRGAGADCGSCRLFLQRLLDVESAASDTGARSPSDSSRVA